MSDCPDWISAEEFADLANISPQAARKALRESASGKTWRGRKLRVRRVLTRGGRGGVAWQVWSESVGALERPRAEECRLPRPTVSSSDPLPMRRWEVICDALAHAPQSAARAEAIEQAALRSGASIRTIYRWIDRYEAHGLRGLARSTPSNTGERRVFISRPFDHAAKAFGATDAVLAELAGEMEKMVKGLWASRAEQAGCSEVRRLAEFMLLELCERRGLTVPHDAIRLSRRWVERFALYRVVNQRRNDRKAFDDAKPRIRRDWTALAPMERVVADVKHLDVIVTRADGTPAWPKIVAFMDAGTGRVLVHPVLLERGEGVRQEHVIEAFLAMAAAPNWGFPQGLYLDNGAEFGALVKIDAALQLINEPGARTLIYARPYNASAKPIESLFARLDRYVFSLLPGYAGPNRLAAKTQAVGKPPKPYPGAWEAFCSTVQELVGAYNLRPVGGPWQNRPPDDWLREKVAAGWRPTSVDLLALDAAFADHDSRRVDRGVVKIAGERFSHPSLAALPARTAVDLALPWRRGAEPLARIGGQWIYLKRETLYPARWIEGARESSRRQSVQRQHVSAMAREALRIDPVETKIRWARRFADVDGSPPSQRIDLGSELDDLGVASAAREPASAMSDAELRRVREMTITERLERMQRRDS